MIAVAQAEAEGVRKEAEALGQAGRRRLREDAGRRSSSRKKRILIVPGTNVSTMDVNKMVDFLLGRAEAGTPAPAK